MNVKVITNYVSNIGYCQVYRLLILPLQVRGPAALKGMPVCILIQKDLGNYC